MAARINKSKVEREKEQGWISRDLVSSENDPSQVTFSPVLRPELGGLPARVSPGANWMQEYGRLLGVQEFEPLPVRVVKPYSDWDTINIHPTEEWTTTGLSLGVTALRPVPK